MSKKVFARTLWDVKVPMRDGVKLSADIYLPPDSVEPPYPTILVRTPYDNSLFVGLRGDGESFSRAQFFALNGYAFVIQDVRGRCDSDGVWYPFFNEGPDGYDTIEWFAKQSWCNGKIGMMGGSYVAYVQWAAAREYPPHLTTLVSSAPGGLFMKCHTGLFINGVPTPFILGFLQATGGRTQHWAVNSAVDWEKVFYHLPLKDMDEALGRSNTVWKEWLSHPNLDDYWKRGLLNERDFKGISLPALHMTGWYDACKHGTLFFYQGMIKHSPARDRQYLIVGPWDHSVIGSKPGQKVGGIDFTRAAFMDMDQIHLDWFDHWLKDKKNDVPNWKHVKYFVMGENKWVEENGIWPPRDIKQTRFYLHSKGKANTLLGDGSLNFDEPGEETYDRYTYNPEDPVMAIMDWEGGGGVWGVGGGTPLDKRFILRRDDVLVYTSKPLEKELMIAGRPVLKLYASSDCRDTDWFATLADVYPDGRSIPTGEHMLSYGMLRARYRNSLEKPELMTPGKVYIFTIELPSTCIVFKSGHRIRLSITSSLFPFQARNQNTGNDIADDIEIKIANNTIYHNKSYPSHVLLPIK